MVSGSGPSTLRARQPLSAVVTEGGTSSTGHTTEVSSGVRITEKKRASAWNTHAGKGPSASSRHTANSTGSTRMVSACGGVLIVAPSSRPASWKDRIPVVVLDEYRRTRTGLRGLDQDRQRRGLGIEDHRLLAAVEGEHIRGNLAAQRVAAAFRAVDSYLHALGVGGVPRSVTGILTDSPHPGKRARAGPVACATVPAPIPDPPTEPRDGRPHRIPGPEPRPLRRRSEGRSAHPERQRQGREQSRLRALRALHRRPSQDPGHDAGRGGPARRTPGGLGRVAGSAGRADRAPLRTL